MINLQPNTEMPYIIQFSMWPIIVYSGYTNSEDTDGLHLLSAAVRQMNSVAFHECRIHPHIYEINYTGCWGHLIAIGC